MLGIGWLQIWCTLWQNLWTLFVRLVNDIGSPVSSPFPWDERSIRNSVRDSSHGQDFPRSAIRTAIPLVLSLLWIQLSPVHLHSHPPLSSSKCHETGYFTHTLTVTNCPSSIIFGQSLFILQSELSDDAVIIRLQFCSRIHWQGRSVNEVKAAPNQNQLAAFCFAQNDTFSIKMKNIVTYLIFHK